MSAFETGVAIARDGRVVAFSDGALLVRGYLHEPLHPSGDALVLTHGAGSNCEAPLLVAVAGALAGMGITVLRSDLPFRQLRRYGPPSPAGSAQDREGLRRAVLAVRKIASGRVFLGGHSYGGRQASMLAATDPDLAAGLLLLSYPLHPPRRPSELRTAHFPKLRIPCLFVHGTRDPFGTAEEMRAALAQIPSPAVLEMMDGASHDLSIHGRVAEAAARALAAFRGFVEKDGHAS